MRIEVESWQSPSEARSRYADTLTWPRENAPRGRSFHVGDGVWVTTCSECEAYCETFGTMPRYATIGPHEVSEHALAVPGVNVGTLP